MDWSPVGERILHTGKACRAPNSENGAWRKILIISYNYPTVGSIGAIRAVKPAKCLPHLGWLVTVLTVSSDRTKWSTGDPEEGIFKGVSVIRAPFPDILTRVKDALCRFVTARPCNGALVRAKQTLPAGEGSRRCQSLLRGVGRLAAFPDRYFLWLPAAFLFGLRELRRGDYDLIISTSPPVTSHIIAALLHRFTRVPRVADLRDPWVHPYIDAPPVFFFLSRRLEARILGGADAVTTVSSPLAEEATLARRSGNGEVVCITNGFDPNDRGADIEPPAGNRLVIRHTGVVFGLKQDPSTLVSVVEEMIGEKTVAPDRALLRFFGPSDPELQSLKASMRYSDVLEINDVVPRSEALAAQRESTALLVLLWDHPYTRGIYGGKVLEYLGPRWPILAWNPVSGIVGDLLECTGAGVAVSSREELKAVLSAWLNELRDTVKLTLHGNDSEIERYNWEILAGKFAELFDRVAECQVLFPASDKGLCPIFRAGFPAQISPSSIGFVTTALAPITESSSLITPACGRMSASAPTLTLSPILMSNALIRRSRVTSSTHPSLKSCECMQTRTPSLITQ